MDFNEVRKIIKESFYIILFTVTIGFAVNLFHPKGYILVSRGALENRRIISISVNEAKIKFDKSSALFIDSRSREEYNETHIKGAVNIPASPDSLSYKKIKSYYSEIAGPIEVVIYCGRSCSSSEVLAKRFLEMGYSRNIYLINNAFPAWEENNFPIEKHVSEGDKE